MDPLRQLSSPTAFVIRDGEGVPIPAKNVVPGDNVQIKTGDGVTADVSLQLCIASKQIHKVACSAAVNRSLELRSFRTTIDRRIRAR